MSRRHIMNKKHLFVSAAMSALIGIGSVVSGFSSGTTALAAGNTPVRGPVVYAQKYLVMDEEANVPNVTFEYRIEPGTAIPYNKKENKSAVIAGPTGGAAIGKAVFTSGDTAYTEKQAQVRKTDKKDTVGLKPGLKYARSEVKIDLSQVTYTEPGVYRYNIIEDTSTPVQAITFDKADTRYLDVYIHSNDEGKLSVAGSILHKTASDVLADGTNPPEKDNGFENLYTTHNLTVNKTVTGNQASHNRYFNFTVKITSAIPGTVYSVDLDQATKTEINQDGKSYTNPAKLTAGKDGSVTATYMLRHGESVCIQGLADTTKYTVSEDSQDYDAEVKVDTKWASKDTTGEKIIKADTTEAFQNTRQGIVPTGLFENGAVWGILLGAGIIGFVAAFRRKKG